MSFKEFLKSKWSTIPLAIALFLVMIITARILVQKYQIDREIGKLQDQVNKIKNNNDQLSSLIKYFNTPDYQEKQAREKLNLKKDGEYVVVLPNSTENNPESLPVQNKPSNLKLWYNYIFGGSNK